MNLADRRTVALATLAHREPPTHEYPGETQPSGDMPVDWREAVAYLNARDQMEKGTDQ